MTRASAQGAAKARLEAKTQATPFALLLACNYAKSTCAGTALLAVSGD